MPTIVWNNVRTEILKYFATHSAPVQMAEMVAELRKNQQLRGLRDAEFRDVVQPMIASGRLRYAPGLKIQGGHVSSERSA